MSLDHAILGFLSLRPFTGYDLKKEFDRSVRHFWPADQSQIYRTLTRLQENGWVAMQVVEGETRPDRKVFTITPPGEQELHTWLTADLPVPELRFAPLIQLFFAAHLGDDEVLARLQYWRANLLEKRTALQSLMEEASQNDDADLPKRQRAVQELTLDYGLQLIEGNLTWVEKAIARLTEERMA